MDEGWNCTSPPLKSIIVFLTVIVRLVRSTRLERFIYLFVIFYTIDNSRWSYRIVIRLLPRHIRYREIRTLFIVVVQADVI